VKVKLSLKKPKLKKSLRLMEKVKKVAMMRLKEMKLVVKEKLPRRRRKRRRVIL